MREILFRGISKKTGRHVFGDLFHDRDRTVISWYDENGEYQEEEIEPETIEQFTGVYAKDGRKIFEGDTVGFETFGEGDCGMVHFREGKFFVGASHVDGYIEYFDDIDCAETVLATYHC